MADGAGSCDSVGVLAHVCLAKPRAAAAGHGTIQVLHALGLHSHDHGNGLPPTARAAQSPVNRKLSRVEACWRCKLGRHCVRAARKQSIRRQEDLQPQAAAGEHGAVDTERFAHAQEHRLRICRMVLVQVGRDALPEMEVHVRDCVKLKFDVSINGDGGCLSWSMKCLVFEHIETLEPMRVVW